MSDPQIKLSCELGSSYLVKQMLKHKNDKKKMIDSGLKIIPKYYKKKDILSINNVTDIIKFMDDVKNLSGDFCWYTFVMRLLDAFFEENYNVKLVCSNFEVALKALQYHKVTYDTIN